MRSPARRGRRSARGWGRRRTPARPPCSLRRRESPCRFHRSDTTRCPRNGRCAPRESPSAETFPRRPGTARPARSAFAAEREAARAFPPPRLPCPESRFHTAMEARRCGRRENGSGTRRPASESAPPSGGDKGRPARLPFSRSPPESEAHVPAHRNSCSRARPRRRR